MDWLLELDVMLFSGLMQSMHKLSEPSSPVSFSLIFAANFFSLCCHWGIWSERRVCASVHHDFWKIHSGAVCDVIELLLYMWPRARFSGGVHELFDNVHSGSSKGSLPILPFSWWLIIWNWTGIRMSKVTVLSALSGSIGYVWFFPWGFFSEGGHLQHCHASWCCSCCNVLLVM